MLRAMYSGVSGMAAHMTKLNVIGNNIANANTYGFKSSRVVFSDVLYQNLSTSAAGTAQTGGINASQLGYGAKVGSIDVNNGISSGADTGRALDVYINGEGYIPVKTNEGSIKYTRVGDLKFDTEGNLTDGSGSRVLGVPLDADNKPILEADGTIKVENLVAINVPKADLEKCTGITIGPSGEITGIKQSDPVPAFNAKGVGITEGKVDAASNYTGEIKITTTPSTESEFRLSAAATDKGITSDIVTLGSALETDTLVKDIKITKATTKDAANNDVITYTLTGTNVKTGKTMSLSSTEEPPVFDLDGDLTTTTDDTITVDCTTVFVESDGSTPSANGSIELGTIGAKTNAVSATIYDQGGTAHTVTGQWDGVAKTFTLAGTDATEALTLTVDPVEFATIGTLSNVAVGTVKTTDEPLVLGYMAIAKFANPDGLSREGSGYYAPGANSGDPTASLAGTDGTGSLKSSSLEMSNVDIAAEFTEMITAQRGFQANTRLITVSDSILEELINLKR